MARKRRILIVDDEWLITTAICRGLSPEEFDCRLTGDETTALSEFSQWHPDCVLLDVRLESGDHGPRLAREMRARETRNAGRRHVPIVAMTAFLPEMFDAEPFDGYIKKPFTNAKVERAVREAMKGGDSDDARE